MWASTSGSPTTVSLVLLVRFEAFFVKLVWEAGPVGVLGASVLQNGPVSLPVLALGEVGGRDGQGPAADGGVDQLTRRPRGGQAASLRRAIASTNQQQG